MHAMSHRGMAFVGTCTTAGRSMLPTELMKGGAEAEALHRGESLYAFSDDGKGKWVVCSALGKTCTCTVVGHVLLQSA